MIVHSIYPVVMSESPGESAAFYTEWFGFEPSFVTDWYVSLKRTDGERVFELAFLAPDHPSVPAGHGVPARGVILNFEVEDSTEEYRRLVTEGGIGCLLPLRDEQFGQRHFIIADPAGNLVDVIQNIPADSSFEASYVEN